MAADNINISSEVLWSDLLIELVDAVEVLAFPHAAFRLENRRNIFDVIKTVVSQLVSVFQSHLRAMCLAVAVIVCTPRWEVDLKTFRG